MDAPDPPPAPDPVATANAQANANVQTAIGNSILNNANVNGPTGSTRFDITGYQTIKDVNGNDIQVPRYTQTTSLSPEQQQLYDQQVGLGQQMNGIAGQALNSASSVLSTPQTSAPQLQQSYATGGQIQTGYDPGGSIQTQVNTGDINAARDAATNAVLQRLQPGMDQQSAALQAQLANQGVTQGSAAWNAAMLSNAQSQNDLRLGAVQTGDQEQQALFQQALQRGQFTNAAQAQANGQNAAAAAFNNQAAQQGDARNQALAGFGNSAALQQFQADAATRDQPLNEISALMHGGQVTMPQFNGYQGGTIAQTPYSQDVYASAAIDQQNYQSQLQQSSAMMNGLFGMGSKMMGLFAFSDRRLKRDVVRLGRMPNGLDLYAWSYLWGGPREVGHMADEVAAVAPHAVAQHPSGFLMVDYARV